MHVADQHAAANVRYHLNANCNPIFFISATQRLCAKLLQHGLCFDGVAPRAREHRVCLVLSHKGDCMLESVVYLKLPS